MITATPISSAITPTLLMRDISRTPKALIAVVKRMVTDPRMMAFLAGSSTTWNPDHTWGRITCIAIATAATVTMEPIIIVQPAIQATPRLLTCFDHWYTEPAIGYRAPSSPNTSATHSWPLSTISQDQNSSGPPKP